MARHRAVIIGAGRIGAGWNWLDDAHTHAGAYLALKDRVELVGFVEPIHERAYAASQKWGLDWRGTISEAVDMWMPDIVSICTKDDDHAKTFIEVLKAYEPCQEMLKGIWVEKPFYLGNDGELPIPIQVNYQRRADPLHRTLAVAKVLNKRLVVYGKDDETTRCHFRDLSRFWEVPLDYRPFQGPCAYVLETNGAPLWFDNGGIDSGKCFKLMLGNLLDAVEGKADLWSPPYVESK